MFPQGVIYQAGKSNNSGEAKLRPGFILKILYHCAKGIGGGFIAFGVVGLIFSYYPVIQEEISFNLNKPNTNNRTGFGDLLGNPSAEELKLDPFFSIYVPKINAKAKVIPNVNAGSYTEYTKSLQKG